MTPEQIVDLKHIAECREDGCKRMFQPLVRALLAEWECMTQMMQRIAEDVLPDPVRYADLTPEMVRDGFIKAWEERGREIETLRANLEQTIRDRDAAVSDHLTALDDAHAKGREIERLKAETADLWNKWSGAEETARTAEARLAKVAEAAGRALEQYTAGDDPADTANAMMQTLRVALAAAQQPR